MDSADVALTWDLDAPSDERRALGETVPSHIFGPELHYPKRSSRLLPDQGRHR